jgi:hypothetical protein
MKTSGWTLRHRKQGAGTDTAQTPREPAASGGLAVTAFRYMMGSGTDIRAPYYQCANDPCSRAGRDAGRSRRFPTGPGARTADLLLPHPASDNRLHVRIHTTLSGEAVRLNART